nr:hypothetical protein [Tanacetum cinerariifolium]
MCEVLQIGIKSQGYREPEYLPPADDVLPAEEQPLPATVSPTAESPGYITELEPEMEPEEDGDDEKSEEDSIKYQTSGGDDDADDDGDDLSEDDADDEEEESPQTVRRKRKTSTSGSETIPEADIPLRKRARFTTPTGGYEVGERGDIFAPCLPLMHRRLLTPVIIVLRSWTTTSHERSTQVPPVTPAPTATITTVTEAQLQALIDQGVAAAMAEVEASRVRNGYGKSDRVEKYIGGVPDMIHDSVKATKP